MIILIRLLLVLVTILIFFSLIISRFPADAREARRYRSRSENGLITPRFPADAVEAMRYRSRSENGLIIPRFPTDAIDARRYRSRSENDLIPYAFTAGASGARRSYSRSEDGLKQSGFPVDERSVRRDSLRYKNAFKQFESPDDERSGRRYNSRYMKVFVNAHHCPADENEPWSYNAKLKNGPDYWGETYSMCYGEMQSPIDIVSENVESDDALKKIELYNYDKPVTQFKIENNGHSVKVTPDDGVTRTALINGDVYKLDQFHFHWGDKYYTGSEHSIDGKHYALELHLVHVDEKGRIAVVAAFYGVSLLPNSELNPLIDSFERIKYRGDKIDVGIELNLDKLVENGCNYLRYEGSLTTPGCNEGVIWSICKNPLTIGFDQIEEFRKLYSARKSDKEDISHCKISNNFRPIQPLNNRIVKSST